MKCRVASLMKCRAGSVMNLCTCIIILGKLKRCPIKRCRPDYRWWVKQWEVRMIIYVLLILVIEVQCISWCSARTHNERVKVEGYGVSIGVGGKCGRGRCLDTVAGDANTVAGWSDSSRWSSCCLSFRRLLLARLPRR